MIYNLLSFCWTEILRVLVKGCVQVGAVEISKCSVDDGETKTAPSGCQA